MKLVASMPVHNELGRYLPMVVESLLVYVDEIRALDDGSTDGSFEYLEGMDRVTVARNPGRSWREHEGEFRRALQDFTLKAEPSHILAIDADEVVTDGAALRRTLFNAPARETVFTLRMTELWSLDPPTVRHDGGWRPHEAPLVYRVPKVLGRDWHIAGPVLACPRVPPAARLIARRRRATATGIDVLHLGWAKPEERAARVQRYAELDGGRFHAAKHLRSIVWPDERCDLRPYAGDFPAALA